MLTEATSPDPRHGPRVERPRHRRRLRRAQDHRVHAEGVQLHPEMRVDSTCTSPRSEACATSRPPSSARSSCRHHA
ncbi:MAG: hypothetical protein R3A52_17805 [Polyangiales bacterium]